MTICGAPTAMTINEEIGNLLRAGELDALGEQVDDAPGFLRKEQIGVWHFEKNAPVKEIPYDRFAGVEPQEYGAIAETLYNRSASLQNQLEIATQGRPNYHVQRTC